MQSALVPFVVHRQLLSLLTGVHKVVELPQVHVLMRVIKAARLSFTTLSIITLPQHVDTHKCYKMTPQTSFIMLATLSTQRIRQMRSQQHCARYGWQSPEQLCNMQGVMQSLCQQAELHITASLAFPTATKSKQRLCCLVDCKGSPHN